MSSSESALVPLEQPADQQHDGDQNKVVHIYLWNDIVPEGMVSFAPQVPVVLSARRCSLRFRIQKPKRSVHSGVQTCGSGFAGVCLTLSTLLGFRIFALYLRSDACLLALRSIELLRQYISECDRLQKILFLRPSKGLLQWGQMWVISHSLPRGTAALTSSTSP
jgi:hypothetical protein